MVDRWTGQKPRQVLSAVQHRLQEAGCPDADFDAGELLRFVLGTDPRLADRALTEAESDRLEAMVQRRCKREPLQYLLGEWDFLDFTLQVGEGVLCPRADSEVVCETAAELLQKSGKSRPRVLDLCAGSGCLGLGIVRFVPDAQVLCVEKSPAALPYLRINAENALKDRNLRVDVAQGDIFNFYAALPPESVDLIISNPPYLTEEEMRDLMPETAHEPVMALAGGRDGLQFYHVILRHYRAALCPGGWLVLEIGYRQAEAVLALAHQYGWGKGECRRDYGGCDRVIVLKK